MHDKDHKTEAQNTTGHDWDGITEYDAPIPRWWLWTLYATIIFAVVYCILYPSLPLIHGNSTGLLASTNRANLNAEIAQDAQAKSVIDGKIIQANFQEILHDEPLRQYSIAAGKSIYALNCTQCHNDGAQGNIGFPNLLDDDWLWGGKIEEIHQTIQYGVRSGHAKARDSQMPAFGTDGILNPQQIADVSAFVLNLSQSPIVTGKSENGKKIFADNCAACHGEKATGNREIGAPNLTDAIWLYGKKQSSIIETISKSRQGQMRAWGDVLTPVQLKQVAIYIHELGGGE